MEENVIYTRELTKRFGTFTAVDRITFSVRRGEIFGFLGANGAGKTTAMRMLCGLSVPTAGEGRVAGFDIALYEDLKVWENLRLFGGIYGMKDKEIARKTDEMLAGLGFEALRDTFVRALPLGWKQKLAFSVSIFHEPRVGTRRSIATASLSWWTGGLRRWTRPSGCAPASKPLRWMMFSSNWPAKRSVSKLFYIAHR